MEKALVLSVFWVLLTLVSSEASLGDTHVLQYFYTLTLNPVRKTHFVSVGLLDGVQIAHYDSESQREVPTVEWMNQDSTFWREETDSRKDDQGRFSALMETFNHSHGQLQTFQAMCECGFSPGRTWGVIRNAHNGQPFLTFDRESGGWLAVAPSYDQAVALRVKRLWERQSGWTYNVGEYVKRECLRRLNSFLPRGQTALQRKEPPELIILNKGQGELVCLATGYYPRGARLQWVWDRSDEPVAPHQLEGGEELPNGDGTYQTRLTLKLNARVRQRGKEDEKMEKKRNEGEYKCTVIHSSLDSPLMKKLEQHQTLSLSLGISALLLVVVVVGVIIVIKKRFISNEHHEVAEDDVIQQTAL